MKERYIITIELMAGALLAGTLLHTIGTLNGIILLGSIATLIGIQTIKTR